MYRLILLVFFFISLKAFPQCEDITLESNSNYNVTCFEFQDVNNATTINLTGIGPINSQALWSCPSSNQVSFSNQNTEITVNDQNNTVAKHQVTASFSSIGIYNILMSVTLNNGIICSKNIEINVHEKIEQSNNFQLNYYLCDDTINTTMEINNSNLFTSENWLIQFIPNDLSVDSLSHGLGQYQYSQSSDFLSINSQNSSSYPDIWDNKTFQIATNVPGDLFVVYQVRDQNQCSYSGGGLHTINNGLSINDINLNTNQTINFCEGNASPSDYILENEDLNYSYNWIITSISGFQSNINNFSGDFPYAGEVDLDLIVTDQTNSYLWTPNNQCQINFDIQENIQINPLPFVEITSLNSFYCESDLLPPLGNIETNPTGNYNYEWTVTDPGNNTSAPITTTNLNYNFDLPGNYDVDLRVENDYGCSNTNSTTVIIEEEPNVDIHSLLQDTVHCGQYNNTIVNLENNPSNIGSFSYEWTVTDPENNTSAPITTTDLNYDFDLPGDYQVKLIVENLINSCSTEDLLSFTIVDIPNVEISPLQSEYCHGNNIGTINNNALNNPNYGTLSNTWVVTDPNNITTYQTSLDYDFSQHQIMGQYQITLTVDNGICDSYQTENFTLEDLSLLQFNFATQDPLCQGFVFKPMDYSTGQIETNVNYSSEIIDISNQIFASDNTLNPVFNMSAHGLFDYKLIVNSNISSCEIEYYENDAIEINQQPIAEMTLDGNVLINGQTTYVCEVPGSIDIINSSYQNLFTNIVNWKLKSAGIIIFEQNTPNFNYTFNETGLYTLELINTSNVGCESDPFEIQLSVHDIDLNFQSSPPDICYLESISLDQYVTSNPLEPSVNYEFNLIDPNQSVSPPLYSTHYGLNEIWNMDHEGIFDLNVVVSDGPQCQKTTFYPNYITIKLLQAKIDENQIEDCAILPTTLQIQESSQFDPSLSPQYNWTFTYQNGNQESDNSPNPILNFDEPSLVDASLTISYDINNNKECTSNDNLLNQIGINGLSAELDLSKTISSNCLPYTFSASQINIMPENSNYNYSWELIHSTNNSVPNQFSNTYDGDFTVEEGGNYNLKLIVNDNNNNCNYEEIAPQIVFMDHYDLEIEKTDINNCFNTVNLNLEILEKDFQIKKFQSVYGFPMQITDWTWDIRDVTGGDSLIVVPTDQSINDAKFLLNQPGTYRGIHTRTLDNSNCQYTDSVEFNIGILVDIEDINNNIIWQDEDPKNIVCLGSSKPLIGEASIGIGNATTYTWFADPPIIISDNSNLLTTFTTENQEGFFDITLEVVNDSACIGTKTKTIEIYELKPDFTIENAIMDYEKPEQCVDDTLKFQGTFERFIHDFSWNFTGQNYIDGQPLNIFSSGPSSNFDFISQDIALDIDIKHTISSIHGCTAYITKPNEFNIIRPIPNFLITNEYYGCDNIDINIIDQSDTTLLDSITFFPGLNEYNINIDFNPQDYNIVGNQTLTYDFPYDSANNSYNFPYEYNIRLASEYHSCLDTFSRSVFVYPNPQINEPVADFYTGCAPITLNFQNTDEFIGNNTSFYWNFDSIIGQDPNNLYTSIDLNPNQEFTIKKFYSFSHKATNNYNISNDILQCSSIKFFENFIEIVDPPIANFSINNTKFCYNQGDAIYINETIYDSDLENVTYTWVYNDMQTSNSENLEVFYDASGEYEIKLLVEDENGCFDDIIRNISIKVLDTIVSKPIMNYTTSSDIGIDISWSNDLDDNFDNINLYHETNFSYWENIYDSYDINDTTFYFHDVANPYQNNFYTMIQQDSCGYYSDSSYAHSPMLLSAQSNTYEVIRLDWTPYIGWSYVKYYHIYRSTEGSEFEYIDQVLGNTISYEDSNLCKLNYQYYVEAIHPQEENYNSRSNKASMEPLFVDFTTPIYIENTSVYTTIQGDEVIITKWPVIIPSNLSYYKINRWDQYYGWLELETATLESPYVDFNVDVHGNNYKYRVQYKDICGNEGPISSNYGKNILLEGKRLHSNHINLTWNAYEDWTDGVGQYQIQYYNPTLNAYQHVETVSASTFEIKNIPLIDSDQDTSYCYRVMASNLLDPSIRSYSNKKCFLGQTNDVLQNAFSPNNDGLNDYYKLTTNSIETINIEIYDRWGNMVFNSNDIYFEWDGKNKNSGKDCPQGSYIIHYEIIDFDGINTSGETTLMLLR